MKIVNQEKIVALKNRYQELIQEQEKAMYLTNPYQLNIEVTRILNEKNKITIELMNLKEKL